MRWAVLGLLVACGGSSSDKGGVAVELASVTLADDCGEHGYMPPPKTPPPAAKEKREAATMVASEDRAASESLYRSCAQTSMQIAFSADRAVNVQLKKVELLDATGKFIQDLAPRMPMRWNGKGYEKWDEKLVASQPLSASYALAAPSWDKLGGRMTAQSKTYHLHVVVVVGDTEHSLDKQAIAPVVMQPDVVTLR